MKKIIALTVIIVLLLCGCSNEASRTKFLLNTTVKITLYGGDEQYFDDAFALCEQYEKLFSRTDQNSDIYKINNQSGNSEVDNNTIKLIEKSKKYYDLSDGKFDITIGAVSQLWDFNNGVLPDSESIAKAIEQVNINKIQIEGNTVAANGCILDLGAIAKGYIADTLKESLESKGVKRAVLNLGGNVTVMGEEYTVGIRKPFSENEIIASVKAKNTTVATSGVYERCFEKDSKQYHHILDSKTGYPANTDLLSATVICKSGADADALSTVCILAGKQKAIEIIEQISDAQAIFVDENYNVFATSGLEYQDGTYIPLI